MDPGNRERGLKAAINNPRVSEQAKQRDREILESEFGTHMPEESTTVDIAEEEVLTDISSSKLGSSSTSSKKGRSKSAGNEASAGIKQSSTSADMEGKDRGNVIRGLKAAINNPNVSEKAKEKDRKKLHELGESID